jgi:hypothetical protein
VFRGEQLFGLAGRFTYDARIDDSAPLGLDDYTGLFHKLLGVPAFLTLLLGTAELFAFGKAHAHEADEEARARTNVEQVLEAIGTSTGSDAQVEDSSQEKAHGVALLQDARHQAAGLEGDGLESHGDGTAPNASHTDTEQGADSEKGVVGWCICGAELERADDEPGVVLGGRRMRRGGLTC